MDGQGIFEWPDGRKYIWSYRDDKKDGDGSFYCTQKKIWKKGIWDNGKRVKWIDGESSEKSGNENYE